MLKYYAKFNRIFGIDCVIKFSLSEIRLALVSAYSIVGTLLLTKCCNNQQHGYIFILFRDHNNYPDNKQRKQGIS